MINLQSAHQKLINPARRQTEHTAEELYSQFDYIGFAPTTYMRSKVSRMIHNLTIDNPVGESCTGYMIARTDGRFETAIDIETPYGQLSCVTSGGDFDVLIRRTEKKVRLQVRRLIRAIKTENAFWKKRI
jgi:hypothetical protein